MMKRPAFQFYPADFLSDERVALMSNQEIGCYIKLICYCWREGSIPSDVSKIARLCGEDSSAMAQLWQNLCECFEAAISNKDRLVHPRLEKERQKQEEHRKERSEAGKAGAKSRWEKAKGNNNNDLSDDCSAIAQPCDSHSSAISLPMAKDSFSSSSSTSVLDISDIPSEYPLAGSEKNRPRQSAEKKSRAKLDYETGVITGISQSLLSSWEEAYPAIDVREEIRKAKAWLLANPANRKKNLERFLNSWLSKAQDSAGRIKHAISGTDHIDNSAAGRVRAAVARSRAEREAAEQPGDRSPMADDGLDVRASVVEFIRRGG